MIIVIFVISILLVILGLWLACELDCLLSGTGLGVLGGIGFIISLIAIMVLCCSVSGLRTIDARIEMYQEENAKIEEQIADVVEQYQKYETDIFTEVAPDSSVTLVALYPELKSDTLVQKQIEVYMANNEKIKELREEKIGAPVLRWWLYFGG